MTSATVPTRGSWPATRGASSDQGPALAVPSEAGPPADGRLHPSAGDGCASDQVLLAATLVTALEQALLAARRLLGTLDRAAGRQTDAAAHPQYTGPLPALIGPCGGCRGPLGVGADGAASAIHAASATLIAPGGLSRREAEVLRLLVAGQSARQSARALYLSPRTVQRHVANLYLKIGAHNRAEAIAYALRHGLA